MREVVPIASSESMPRKQAMKSKKKQTDLCLSLMQRKAGVATSEQRYMRAWAVQLVIPVMTTMTVRRVNIGSKTGKWRRYH